MTRRFTQPRTRRPIETPASAQDTTSATDPPHQGAAPVTPPRHRPKRRYALKHPYKGSNGFKRRMYHLLFFDLPMLYFARVVGVLEYAWICSQEIAEIARTGDHALINSLPYWQRQTPPEKLTPDLRSFMDSWKEFVESLLQEWTTVMHLSTLIIMVIFVLSQSPVINANPALKNMAYISITFASASALCGALYIAQFGSLRNLSKALSWAAEAQGTLVSVWSSIWVILAIPMVCLAWSGVFFFITILMFAWKSSPDSKLAPSIFTTLFMLGFVLFVFILTTLKRYGRLNVHYVDDESDTSGQLNEMRGAQAWVLNINSSPY